MNARVPSRVLRLPDRGSLLVCTDLHGNLGDFRRMRYLFERTLERSPRSHLLFSGDLVHGPNYSRAEWPSYLGSFYEDCSGQLLDEFSELRDRHPGQVHALLGNHEHSHIGGPHTPKFWADETAHFEHTVGPERSARYQQLFRSFHVVALAPCGLAVTHAAPNAEVESIEEIEQLPYEGYETMNVLALQAMPLLGRLLWARGCPTRVARRFLDALADPAPNVVAFGHEIVTRGFEIIDDAQLLLSTSFGVADDHKYYLQVDLAGRYDSTAALRVGQELRRLHG